MMMSEGAHLSTWLLASALRFWLQIREEKPEQAPEQALKLDNSAPAPAPITPQKQPEPSLTPPAKVNPCPLLRRLE